MMLARSLGRRALLLALLVTVVFAEHRTRWITTFSFMFTLAFWVKTEPGLLCLQDVQKQPTAEDCVRILKARMPTTECPFRNTLSTTEARAIPNKSLVTAFDISNCFVTTDPEVCSNFRREAKDLLKLDDDGWKGIRDVLDESIRVQIPTSVDTIRIVPKVQFVSLKLALHVLCCRKTALEDDDGIYTLADEINKQWIWSKTANDQTPESRLPVIRSVMDKLFPEWEAEGCPSISNPLNLILPGYETLWRVVLRGLLEVAFRDVDTMDHYQHLLQAFFANPTLEKLNQPESDSGGQNLHLKDTVKHEHPSVSFSSASDIAKEALRPIPAYSPHLSSIRKWMGRSEEVSADIEGLHRNTNIWGHGANSFRPSRWAIVSEEEEKANFLALGASPFSCIAKTATQAGMMPFGVAMVALIVAGLSTELNRSGWALLPIVGEEEVLEAGKPLKTGREAYADLRLKRLSCST